VIKTHHEDITLKCITDFFKEGAAEFFGVKEKILYPLETEINYLEQRQLFADLVFMAENDTIIHFEFQSTDDIKDLYRFSLMDTFFVNCYNNPRQGEDGGTKVRDIKTYVIYTGEIEKTVPDYSMTSLKYSVIPFYMSHFDGDEKYRGIAEKIKTGAALTNEELYSITLLPLMKISCDKADMIEKAVELGRGIEEEHSQSKIIAALGLLAEKFIKDGRKLEEVKEKMRTLKIIQSFIDEGEEKGVTKGITKGLAKAAAGMYAQDIDVEVIARALNLTVREVELMLNLQPA
jgi:predicted transposase/invertase (TIGR01784 family)